MELVQADLGGRTALVTGGASGIGRACALRLAQAGARVDILDLDGDGARQVAASTGGSAHIIDLSDVDGLSTLLAGRQLAPDIVVNNAGLQVVAAIEEFPAAAFSRILRVMVEAPFRILQHTLPPMYVRGWGRVINLSSVHGLRASPFKAAYVTAKHGLEGLSKVAALEGARHGVTSNCVNPAYVRTPLVEKQIAAQSRAHGIAASEVIEKVMLEPAAIKRLIEPAEIAELVAYLCTPHASFITGASLTVDGAWTSR